MKKFSKLEPGKLTAHVGEKTTVINTGESSIFIVDEQAMAGLEELDEAHRQEILQAHYGLKPQQHRDLTAGDYMIAFIFDDPKSKATLLISKAAKPKTVKSEPDTTAS